MGGRRQTLEEYTQRRFALAGASLLQYDNPFFVPFDQLQCKQRAGAPLLNFAHYDYLSIGRDPGILASAAAAIADEGVGAGASRIVGGQRNVHRNLEADLARFVGTDASLAMVSGYGTNLSLIGHLMMTGDLILVDEYAHNSIMTGTRITRADVAVFRHNALDDLDAQLTARRAGVTRALVIVEGLYSMEGDIPDLPRLLRICERHDAWLMVDEAHSIGVLGRTGRGIAEHFNIDPKRIDLIVGTLSKAFATCGGFICARTAIIEMLRYTLPGFVYSVGLPPQIAKTVSEAIALIEREPERVAQLRAISEYFVAAARRAGFNVGTAIGAGIVPVLLSDARSAMDASRALMNAGIYAPPVFQMGVPKDLPRLRFFLSSQHTRAEVDRVFEVLAAWRFGTGSGTAVGVRAPDPAEAYGFPSAGSGAAQ